MDTVKRISESAGYAQFLHELCEVEKTLDLTPEGIEGTALSALYHGLCQIRLVAHNNPCSTYKLADAMHNLPIALRNNDHELIRQYTIEAVHAQRAVKGILTNTGAGDSQASLIE